MTPPITRLLPKLRREPSGCLVFTGALNRPGGYGLIGDASVPRKINYAHRVMYEHTYGPIPEGMLIRHTCDNPPCCEPEHLVLGDYKDNAEDARERGQMIRGERHWAARLTADDVRAIRAKHAGGRSCYSLAKEYGINAPHAERIVARKTWKHIP
jgi:hypothetical protein